MIGLLVSFNATDTTEIANRVEPNRMEDIKPSLSEWAEDRCEVCGAHVGYGVRLFHLGRCYDHEENYEGENEGYQQEEVSVH